MLNPVPSPKAVNGGATGECGSSPRECQGTGVTGVTGFYN